MNKVQTCLQGVSRYEYNANLFTRSTMIWIKYKLVYKEYHDMNKVQTCLQGVPWYE